MSKHPNIDKVRKYLVESGYPEDGDALLSLVAVEAELAPKTFNPQGLAEVLADMDLIIEQEHGSDFGARSLKEHLISFRARIESALASAEPVATVCDLRYFYDGVVKWTGDQLPAGTKLYTRAQPAAKAEAPSLDEVLATIRAYGEGCIRLGMESAPTPASDYPECSGDPASCPENEGHGCCKPNPVKTPASVPDGWRDHGNSALAHISNALDDLDSSPDQRPVPLLNEAMFHIRAMLSPTNQEGTTP